MQVIWNGEVIATVDGSDIRDIWTTINLTVIAGSFDGTNTLTFKEFAKSDQHGIAIDNVQLESNFYQYDLNISAGTNGSDGDLGFVNLAATTLPEGVSIYGLTPTDGLYQIALDGSGKALLKLVSDNKLSAADINEITGSVTLVTEDSNSTATETAYAEIAGETTDDTLTGSDANEMIIGGAGNDILTGGAGKDIFVWNSGDDAVVAGEPAKDVVTDFDISEGDVLDFSDILVGEESGDLTDFISITEDGSDIVIELKPNATDVTQVVTLQGKSLADLGVGGFDTSTQQAEIINKLVQDGHVSVDS